MRADWAGALASPDWKLLGRLPAYIQGWVLYLAFVAGITSYEFQIAQQLTSIRLILANSKLGTPPGALGDISSVSFGVAVPDHPLPAFQQAFYGIMIGFLAFHALMNFLPIKRINQLAICSFAWLIMISSVVMFALPAITPKRNGADFIFKEWVPATTRPPSSSDTSMAMASTSPPSPAISLMATGTNNGWTAMVGLLMSQYLLLVYDTPSHMAEETHDAARTVPKAIMTSYVLGGVLNIGMLISYLACMNLDNYQYNGDYENFGEPLATPDNRVATANFLYLGVTNGLFPVGNIFYDSFMARFGRAEGAAALTFFIFLGTNFTAVLTFTCATRFIFSFARDGGFPGMRFLANVEPRTGVPINACLFLLGSCALLSTAILSPERWFSTINAASSVITNGFLLTYGMGPFLRLVNARVFKPAKAFNLGRLSKPCAVISVGYCAFSIATIALPAFMPATKENLNMAPVALGAVVCFALVTYPFAGPIFNTYSGPAMAHLEDEQSVRAGAGYKKPEASATPEGMEDSARPSKA